MRSTNAFSFVADWHALTTHYQDTLVIDQTITDMVIDWLAAGVNPGSATLFVQSQVVAHAELHLLLSMITPLGWLERVPTYKDQQEKLIDKDLNDLRISWVSPSSKCGYSSISRWACSCGG